MAAAGRKKTQIKKSKSSSTDALIFQLSDERRKSIPEQNLLQIQIAEYYSGNGLSVKKHTLPKFNMPPEMLPIQ